MAEQKLTPLFLKTVSQKFDLETIFLINLSDKGIMGGVGSLGECTNLMHLDISKNRLTMLTGIEGCINLRVLDLSFNKLTTIDALKGCINIERLDLQGNLIKDCKPIDRISPYLTKLKNLYLQEFTGENGNPCCWTKAYRPAIKAAFPDLSSLDGQRLGAGELLDMKELGIDGKEQ